MPEEKEQGSSEEDKKDQSVEDQQDQKSEEDGSQDGFVKDTETVSANKYNQALRKQRELEAKQRELEKQLAEHGSQADEDESDDENDTDLFKDDEKTDPGKIVDEKLKPVFETLKKREEHDRKVQRQAFYEAHPEYLSDSERWQELLDEMDNSLNPNSKDDYYTQLEKAHRIIAGGSEASDVEDKKKEMANDAATGGSGAEKGSVKSEFTAEDRKYQKEWGISDEGMRAFKKKVASGDIQIL